MTTRYPFITIERRRFAALIDALKLSRYAILRTSRRFDCPPHDPHALARTIDIAIAEAKEIHS